jgi:DNA-binding LacI/PurR family transcriptional regulator
MPSTPHPERRRVTAADIAADAGVSRATVGFVLNRTPGQTISTRTRDRVLEAADRLGYRPHVAARALASGRSMIVVHVLPDWPLDHSMRAHLDAASAALDAAGYTLVSYTPHEDGATRPLWETLAPDVVIGTVPFEPDVVAAMRASGVEHIVPAPGLKSPALSSTPFGRGPEIQIEHLVELGHRRIGFAATTDARLRALLEERVGLAELTATRAGVELFAVEGVGDVEQALEHWRAAGVTAVAAYNDELAAAVLQAALRSGLRVPEDLSIIGHDDSPFSALLFPALTTINVDSAVLGRYLADTALASLGGPEPAPLPDEAASLVVRESSGPSPRS